MAAATAQRYAWYPSAVSWHWLKALWTRVPYFVGILICTWAVAGLRYDEVVLWRWIGGPALVAVGALFAIHRMRAVRLRSSGLVMAPEGMIIIAGSAYRIAAREQIHGVRYEHGLLYVIYGNDHRAWWQLSHPPEAKEVQPYAELRYREMEAWFNHGTVPPESSLPPMAGPLQLGYLSGTLKALALAAAMGVFVWLTVVLPNTSDAGRTTQQFIGALAKKDYAAAYKMMSAKRRKEMTRKQFEAQLPAELRNCTGININAVGGGCGTVVGAESCADGFVGGADGTSWFAFELVSEAEGRLAVSRWHEGQCAQQ
jgi:hypothetical protein